MFPEAAGFMMPPSKFLQVCCVIHAVLAIVNVHEFLGAALLQVFSYIVPKGCIIAFEETFVHAGAAGEEGILCPRAHLYCSPTRKPDTTSPVELDTHMAGRFNWHHEKGMLV